MYYRMYYKDLKKQRIINLSNCTRIDIFGQSIWFYSINDTHFVEDFKTKEEAEKKFESIIAKLDIIN